MIKRILTDTVKERFGKRKAILLMGPRQVGKTTLLSTLFKNPNDVLFMNGDELDVRQLFENVSADRKSTRLNSSH